VKNRTVSPDSRQEEIYAAAVSAQADMDKKDACTLTVSQRFFPIVT
jgi:hypothetical protein